MKTPLARAGSIEVADEDSAGQQFFIDFSNEDFAGQLGFNRFHRSCQRIFSW